VGAIKQTGHCRGGTVVGSQGALRRPDSSPVTMQYVYCYIVLFMLQASDLAPLLSNVYTQRWSLPQVLSRHGFCHVARS